MSDQTWSNTGWVSEGQAKPQPPQPQQQGSKDTSMTKLIVNYLPQSFTQMDMEQMFSSVGSVESCKLMVDFSTMGKKSKTNYHSLTVPQKCYVYSNCCFLSFRP